jgi:hypothetical protein
MFFKEKSRDTCIRLDLQDQCAVEFHDGIVSKMQSSLSGGSKTTRERFTGV